MAPAKKDYGHHNYPLERFEKAIEYLKIQKYKKIGIGGASTTGMLALVAASYFPDITLTIAICPSDFVMEGFYRDGLDGTRERPGDSESSVSYKGKPLPYLPYAYRHPTYWEMIKKESKEGGDLIASRKMFEESERLHPIKEEEKIKIENIHKSVRKQELTLKQSYPRQFCSGNGVCILYERVLRKDDFLKYKDFSMEQDGFVGHMAEPEGEVKQAVIVIMGGEKSLLPGIKIAERFADYGMIGLSVSLYGAEGIADGVNLIPLDMLEKAVQYLREERHICSISTYGMSMGSIFAALAAKYIGGIDNVILVSPSHVPFEGSADKKNMTGHSMITWRGEEIPFVKVDFGVRKAGKYFYDAEEGRKVTGMWISYRDAYKDKGAEQLADIHMEDLDARILMIAGTADEAWPSDYSVQYMKEKLDGVDYAKEYKAIIYPNASHLLGMMPNKERNKWLYRMIPVIGLMYRSLWKHKAECLRALDESEKEIIKWIKGSS